MPCYPSKCFEVLLILSCTRLREGVPFDSVRRFRASLLLHTTCVRSCCNFVIGALAV